GGQQIGDWPGSTGPPIGLFIARPRAWCLSGPWCLAHGDPAAEWQDGSGVPLVSGPWSAHYAEQGGQEGEAVAQDVHDDAEPDAAQPDDQRGEDELQPEDQQPVPGLPVVLQGEQGRGDRDRRPAGHRQAGQQVPTEVQLFHRGVDDTVDGQRRQQRRYQNYFGEAARGVVAGDQPVWVDPGERAADGVADRPIGGGGRRRGEGQDGGG